MKYTFTIASIQFEVEYKTIKALRLTVYPPDGDVKIVAPLGTTPEFIKKFASSKIEWIEKHRQKFKKRISDVKSLTDPSLRNHSTVYVWGKQYELELIEREGYSKISLDKSSRIRMCIRPGATKTQKRDLLDRWYRNTLKKTAPAIIEKWEGKTGVKVKKIYVQKMKTHWGSCNYKKQTLRLNSELVKRDGECLDYVVLHEMLHIIEKGHNSKFYGLLDKYLPDWKAIRKRMNSNENYSES